MHRIMLGLLERNIDTLQATNKCSVAQTSSLGTTTVPTYLLYYALLEPPRIRLLHVSAREAIFL